jgi:hypothetical protein
VAIYERLHDAQPLVSRAGHEHEVLLRGQDRAPERCGSILLDQHAVDGDHANRLDDLGRSGLVVVVGFACLVVEVMAQLHDLDGRDGLGGHEDDRLGCILASVTSVDRSSVLGAQQLGDRLPRITGGKRRELGEEIRSGVGTDMGAHLPPKARDSCERRAGSARAEVTL